MEVKHLRTSKDEEFVKHLEDLIEKVKAGEVEECKINVLLTKDAEKKHKKHNVEDLSEEDCKKLLHAIFDEDDEDEPVCNGDCESCENYVEDEEEDDPEEVLEDLGNVIGCLVYYRLPLSPTLVAMYDEAYFNTKEAEYANSEDEGN